MSGALRRADPRESDERRQLTIFFCDLVDSTSLSEALDPEDLADVLTKYQRACVSVIDPLGGYVAQYLGDGVLAYFGFPLAHEDDAIRATRAGLGILAAIDRMNEDVSRAHGVRLAVRVGIHTGLALISRVGSGANGAQLALGETPNIAARAQAAADRHTVVISGATERLVRGWFECESLGARQLKGLSQRVPLFQVTRANEVGATFDIARVRGLSPLVGRNEPLALLLDAWNSAKSGQGAAVLVDGETGIGKSRLVEELRTRAAVDGGMVLELRASPDHDRSALHPPIDHLRRSLGFTSTEAREHRREKFERACDALPYVTDEIRQVLASLLSITDDSDAPLSVTGPLRMQRIQAALSTWLLESAGDAPALIVWEDIHWLDPSSLELMDHLLERSVGRRVLTVVTARSDETVRLPRAPLQRVRLERLPPEAARELIGHLVLPEVIADASSQKIVHMTDGVPLFVEELTRSLLESGALAAPALPQPTADRGHSWVPPTLRDSLMARLDRLPHGREVARVAAVAGREIADDLLRSIWPMETPELERGLSELRDARLVLERWDTGERRWVFSHALTQEVAYESIVRSKRRHYHHSIAAALEGRLSASVATHPELLAKHFALAGDFPQAVARYYEAGRLAVDRSANVEAIDHLRRGLGLLDQIPETPETLQQRLDFLVTLGGPEIARRGYAAPDVGAIFNEARLLCARIPGSRRLFDAAQGLHVHYLVRGDLRTALGLSLELVSLARQLEDPALRLEGTLRLAITSYALGDLTRAKELFDSGLLPALSARAASLCAPTFGQDPYVCALCHSALVTWLLGSPDEAAARVETALHAGRGLRHPFTMSWALLYAALVHALRGDYAATATHAAELADLCTHHGFSYRLTQAHILLCWARVHEHRVALRPMIDAIHRVRSLGAEVFMPLYSAFLAEAALFLGELDVGVDAAADGLAVASMTGEAFFAAELHRLRAELAHARSPDDPSKAWEADLEQARARAAAQGARGLALRAASSSLRLAATDAAEGAREHLRDALARIEGGGGTLDMDAADRLLRL